MSELTLTFRTFRSTDVESLVKHADNRNIWRNLKDRFPHPYTVEDAETWIGMNHLVLGPPVNFAVDLDGQVVGGVGLELGDDVTAKTAQVGYWIAEPYWGRGFATRAVSFISEYAMETFTLERLEALVFDWNAASGRVLEKAGYTQEARLRHAVWKDGRLADFLMYARLR